VKSGCACEWDKTTAFPFFVVRDVLVNFGHFHSPLLCWLRICLRAFDVATIRQGFVSGGSLLVRAVQHWY